MVWLPTDAFRDDIFGWLNQKALQYESPDFIEHDPISIPHLFSQREDIEVAGFLTASLSWGKRSLILKAAHQLLKVMSHSPYSFVMQASEKELNELSPFVYRTFNGVDLVAFVRGLRSIYAAGGMEPLFAQGVEPGLIQFRSAFVNQMPSRTLKHVAHVADGSAGKRLNMFLRWMVRSPKRGVDFGLWKSVSPAGLYLPLDVHTGTVGRELGLLHRKQNDWKAVQEITAILQQFDGADPVRYDFALFGIGVNENRKTDGQSVF